MSENNHNEQQENGYYLVFSTANQMYALSYRDMVQIVDSPVHTALPLAAPSVRGVIDVHDETLPLIDLRILLGSPPLRTEVDDLVRTISARRQDHVNWLKRLKDAIDQGQEITVQTDPHKCNFGLWYDQYEASSATFAIYMKRFDNPHQAVHRIAVQAREHMSSGQVEQAKELVRETENTILKGLLSLFDGFEGVLRKFTHEYAIVLRQDSDTFALAVDSLVVFDRFSETINELPQYLKQKQNQFVSHVGRLALDGKVRDVLILDTDLIHREINS